jgi:hypothetical protein
MVTGARMRSTRNLEAARRFAERRRREDDAPRLHAEVPDLLSLVIEISERKGEVAAETTHLRRVVVASAPAHFEIPCTDPSCQDGGHDVTHGVMRALRERRVSFHGESVCHGSVGSAPCGRVLRYAATATYRS